MKLPKELQLNYDLIAKEFVYKAICVNCVIREGYCKLFCHGDLDLCYSNCRHFHKATMSIENVLNKYDK